MVLRRPRQLLGQEGRLWTWRLTLWWWGTCPWPPRWQRTAVSLSQRALWDPLQDVSTQSLSYLEYMNLEVLKKKIHCCILFQGLSTWGPVSLGLPLEFLTPPFSTLPSAVWWVPFIPLYVLSLNITNWTRDSSSPCKAKITKWLHKPTHSLIIEIFLKQLFFFFSGDSNDEKSILPSSSVDSSFFQHMFSYSFFVLITKYRIFCLYLTHILIPMNPYPSNDMSMKSF